MDLSQKPTSRLILFVSMLMAFIIRVIPYSVIPGGWVIEDGPIIYWFRNFLENRYVYTRLYPHTGILGMSILVWIGVPFQWAAKLWGPLMGAFSTLLIYKILRELDYKNVAIYGAFLYGSLASSVYRTCSLSTSLEATAVMLALLFMWLWHRGYKWSYLFVPIIAYSHFIVFFGVVLYLFGFWWAGTKVSYLKRGLVLSGLGVGLLVVLSFLPVGYALYQLSQTLMNFSILNILSLYSLGDYVLLLNSLTVTCVLFGVTLFYTENKQIKTVAWFYVLAVIATMVFYSPIVSPYRLFIHIAAVGVIGFSELLNKLNKNSRFVLVFGLCALSVFQVASLGLDVHVHFDDAITGEELVMIDWLHDYDPDVDYSRLLWDDVGIENSLTRLSLVTAVDPYTTREKDYGLWYDKVEAKKIITGKTKNNLTIKVNDTITVYDPTPVHVKYVMYSNRYANQALYRLPEENDKLRYRNYVIVDIWNTHPNWVLIYDGVGGKIYERKIN